MSTDERSKKAQAARSIRGSSHAWKEPIPPDPTIRILFHGLMWFFFDENRKCRVGIHNTTRGLPKPHDHPHDFNINVWTINGNRPPVLTRFPIGNPKVVDSIRIDVINPDKLDGVYTYQREPWGKLDPNSDSKDWRWITDFDDLYPGGIRFKPETLSPSVSINNGLFYTFHKTTSEFAFRPDDGSADHPLVGNVAEIMACDIYLKSGSFAFLTILPLPFPFPLPMFGGGSTSYRIDITNNCRTDGKPCSFDPDSKNPRERNDFYLYYETFDLPSDKRKFDLVRTKKGREAPSEPVICYERSGTRYILSNNESPCGPAFGGKG